MSRDDHRNLLASLPLFSSCTKHELVELENVSSEVRVDAGTVLASEGHLGHEFGIIIEGEAVVEKAGEELARLGSGDYYGEVALIEGLTRTATVTAVTDLRLLIIDRRGFATLLDDLPVLTRSLLKAVTRRLREATEELDHLRAGG